MRLHCSVSVLVQSGHGGDRSRLPSRSSRSTTTSSSSPWTRRPRRAAGLIIPASAEAQCRSGIVTAVGPEAAGVEPGDKVLFPKGAGFDVRLGGVAVKVVRRGELIARVHD